MMMSKPCPDCGRQAVRHVRVSLTALYDPQRVGGQDRSSYSLPYDWDDDSDVFFWVADNWYRVPSVKRFWVPFTEPLSYEEAMALYTLWVEAAKGEQIVVLFSDHGCIRGSDDQPWTGLVQLAAFRGAELDFIEQDTEDDEMEWLARTFRWMAEPRTKFTDPHWPSPG